ncbi:CAT RNA binding domain-containing protein [Paenibacillus sp. FSL R5-0701]
MSKGMILQVERVVGSNIVLARSHQNTKEYVLIGKGLGFAFKV